MSDVSIRDIWDQVSGGVKPDGYLQDLTFHRGEDAAKRGVVVLWKHPALQWVRDKNSGLVAFLIHESTWSRFILPHLNDPTSKGGEQAEAPKTERVKSCRRVW